MPETEIRFPEIEVQLVGEDGNAMAIMARVSKAMRRNNVSQEIIKEFQAEAMSGDYDNVLNTCMNWVTCN